MDASQKESRQPQPRYRRAVIGRALVATVGFVVAAACARQVGIQASQAVPLGDDRRLQLFVLPTDFQGPVMVIYDQPDGVRPKAVNGMIIYDVPSNGIVRTVLPEEVLAGSQVRFVYKSHSALLQYHTCTQMRLEGLASDGAAVCWLAIQVGNSAMPDHAVYIITDWTGIPENYNRGARMLDSLFFGGPSGSRFKWQEPRAAPVGKSA
jgi:hypothetical protein